MKLKKIALKFAALISDIPFLYLGRKVTEQEREAVINSLKPGDILLVTDKLFPLWRAALKFICGANYCHTAIYTGNGTAVEATTFGLSRSGVIMSDVNSILYGYKSYCIVRPRYASQERESAAIESALSQIGKPYDFTMSIENDDAMYCSKLVARSLKSAGIESNTLRRFGKDVYVPDEFLNTSGQALSVNNEYVKNDLNYSKFLLLIIIALAFMLPTIYVAIMSTIYVIAGVCQYKSLHISTHEN